jgi:hypothetical protein
MSVGALFSVSREIKLETYKEELRQLKNDYRAYSVWKNASWMYMSEQDRTAYVTIVKSFTVQMRCLRVLIKANS